MLQSAVSWLVCSLGLLFVKSVLQNEKVFSSSKAFTVLFWTLSLTLSWFVFIKVQGYHIW